MVQRKILGIPKCPLTYNTCMYLLMCMGTINLGSKEWWEWGIYSALRWFFLIFLYFFKNFIFHFILFFAYKNYWSFSSVMSCYARAQIAKWSQGQWHHLKISRNTNRTTEIELKQGRCMGGVQVGIVTCLFWYKNGIFLSKSGNVLQGIWCKTMLLWGLEWHLACFCSLES